MFCVVNDTLVILEPNKDSEILDLGPAHDSLNENMTYNIVEALPLLLPLQTTIGDQLCTS